MFYRLFISDACLGKACYDKCKYKYASSSADIRVGDAWGKTFSDNEDGVSAAIAFTKNGEQYLETCNCELTEYPFSIVAEGQMTVCPRRTGLYAMVGQQLKNYETSILDVYNQYLKYNKHMIWKKRFVYPHKVICKIIKRTGF